MNFFFFKFWSTDLISICINIYIYNRIRQYRDFEFDKFLDESNIVALLKIENKIISIIFRTKYHISCVSHKILNAAYCTLVAV